MGQALTNGVVLGSLFAVLAVGLTLVYGTMDVPNFAHAGVITLSAYVMYEFQTRLHQAVWLAVLAGVVAAMVISVATERVAYRFVRDNPLTAPAVALGLLLVLDNSALETWGGQDQAFTPSYAGATIHLGFATIPGVDLAIIVIAATALALLSLGLQKTQLGRSIRAVSQDREAAAILGVRVERQYIAAFSVAGVLAGLAAFAYAPTVAISPYMNDTIILDAFVVIILGGLGSVWGGIAGGLVLGIVESLGATYVSSTYEEVFGFVVLLLILVLRPSGLFTTRSQRVA